MKHQNHSVAVPGTATRMLDCRNSGIGSRARLLAAFVIPVLGLLAGPSTANAWTAPQLHGMMKIGISYGEYYETKSQRTTIKASIPASHFTNIKNAGFSHVRIPITWGYRINTWPAAGVPVTIKSTFVDSVKTSVDRALAAGLVVVINTHHEDWFQYYWAAKNNAVIKLTASGTDQGGLPWEYKSDASGRTAMSVYSDIYKQIVTTFASSAYENVIFEGLNEPAYKLRNKNNWGNDSTWESTPANYVLAFDPANNGNARVNDLNQAIFGVVQSNYTTGARRTYMMTVNNMNNHYSYNQVTLPTYSNWSVTDCKNRLMATLHYYHSLDWTHPSSTPDNTWGTTTDYNELYTRFDFIEDQRDNNLGGLSTHIGEFGVAHNERTGRSDANVQAWYTAATAAAKNRNFTAAVWCDSGWFKVMDHVSGTFPTSGTESLIRAAVTNYDNY